MSASFSSIPGVGCEETYCPCQTGGRSSCAPLSPHGPTLQGSTHSFKLLGSDAYRGPLMISGSLCLRYSLTCGLSNLVRDMVVVLVAHTLIVGVIVFPAFERPPIIYQMPHCLQFEDLAEISGYISHPGLKVFCQTLLFVVGDVPNLFVGLLGEVGPSGCSLEYSSSAAQQSKQSCSVADDGIYPESSRCTPVTCTVTSRAARQYRSALRVAVRATADVHLTPFLQLCITIVREAPHKRLKRQTNDMSPNRCVGHFTPPSLP